MLPHFWQHWWFILLGAVGLIVSGGWGGPGDRETPDAAAIGGFGARAGGGAGNGPRIAQDLHDDLGSSLTRISLLSGLARQDRDQAEQVEVHVNKIAQSAAQTLRALEEIVWALRPGSDTLQSLADYIAHFASELFEGDRLRCRLDLPADLPTVALPPEMRHNIFLIVKEALTNALKHSAGPRSPGAGQDDGRRAGIGRA